MWVRFATRPERREASTSEDEAKGEDEDEPEAAERGTEAERSGLVKEEKKNQ